MKTYNVAILGATGAVGQEMMNILVERKFPINTLKLLASKRSVGKKMSFDGKEITVEEALPTSFENVDIVLGAVENDIAEKLLPYAVKAGAVVIDNSSAYRLDDNVPLVVPEVNPQDIKKHSGIIANPNCSTIIALVAIYKLHEYAKLKSIIASTYQAVSGAGVPGLEELTQQTQQVLNDEEISPKVFPYQIAFNLIPQIGGFDENGYSSEEMKMQNEGRKILHHPDLNVTCTCVRVPVLRSHSESLTLFFEDEISVEKAKEILSDTEGVKLMDNPQNQKYPMPLDTSDQDLVFVGRVRKDLTQKDNKSLSLWCCGDQVRKGAATNAVQIAIEYIKQNA
ncbi:aspartate-semialdehyde dehydrogenase [Breznakia sp. PF5-3]|uniref:aspartate-semialdehyde dehydrogenase n=1 Tax=unclassified Breznakia TaxID=2623764 RepID=UPI00240747BF|nr:MULTISPECIES: aspartate-semialdehyde dehydrogenase [unclassified Breznakia]MDF9825025.1 aspartate-semialdehyde dehydrogenase [Breznakia sp. PM6-1]MDF9835404.1 aspartate-semialdehyde dehydrogenase [Breznakia sp. PF5-3]